MVTVKDVHVLTLELFSEKDEVVEISYQRP